MLFVSQYWSDVHIIPLGGQRLLSMTSRPIKWNSAFASILTNAKCNWLICSQFEIELCHIIVHELLHLLYYPNWNSKCKIKTHWQFEACTSSNIVLATYSTTSSDIHSFCTTIYHANAREVSFFIKQITSKLIPVGTCGVLIEYIGLYLCSIQASIRWSDTCIFPCCCQLNSCLTSGNTHIEVFDATCLKCTIINPLIYAHVCWNRNDDWNRLGIWAMECQLSNYPCILVRVVGEGQLHLLLLFENWSDIKFIPLSLVGILVCALVPIEQYCILTWQFSTYFNINIEFLDRGRKYLQHAIRNCRCIHTYWE